MIRAGGFSQSCGRAACSVSSGQHENREGRRFCAECGAPLAQPCPTCEFINELGEKFCGGCGIPLTGVASSPMPFQPAQQSDIQEVQPVQVESPLPESPRSPHAERRQLTVMFCDLVESTALSGQLDPEDLRDIVRLYQAACTEVIQRYDGHVAQLLGDGLLIYFGYPQAHEDDAQRAMHTSLDIIEAIGTLNTRLEQEKGIKLAVRLGAHTGLVVVGEMGGEGRQEHLALGETPNIAARIQGLAQPDTVVISADTYRLIQRYFDCDALGEHDLRGVSKPIAVYRVLKERDAQSRLDIASARGLTPLVGRDQEIGLLLERWARVIDGDGQVVLLSGEAGIGKSRLVQILKTHVVDTSYTMLECRSSPYFTNSALYPIADLLQHILDWKQADTPDKRLEKLEQALRQYRLPLEETVPLFATLLSLPVPEDHYPPLNLSPQRHRQKTLEAIVAILLELAKYQPVLFVLEDLHWTDPTTLELLECLLDQIPTAPLFTLFTCRPEFQPTWSHRSYLTEMSLSRLSQSQVEWMVDYVTGGKRLPDDVLEQIVEKTDGVPLFVEEMTKAILESGYLQATNEHYELTGNLPALAIPATLQDSLMARLDRLVTAKGVAQYAAVIGRQFAYELLQAVSQLDGPMLNHELGRLVEAEIVYQRGLPPQATYTFKHALIQDAAYGSLLKSTRQQYHYRIAQLLAQRFDQTDDTQPELLAHHYTEAGLSDQAIPYWQQAGQQAIRRLAHQEAIGHVTQGLELIKTLPQTSECMQQELTLQMILGSALAATSGNADSRVGHAYVRALELCQEIGETSEYFQALSGLRAVHYFRGQFTQARELNEKLLSLAQHQQDPRRLLEAYRGLGQILLNGGALLAARTHLAQGMASVDPQVHVPPVLPYLPAALACQFLMAETLWLLGYPDQAWAMWDAGLQFVQGGVPPLSMAWALTCMARLHAYRQQWTDVQTQSEQLIELCAAHGFTFWGAIGTILRGWARTRQGAGEGGIAEIRQGLVAHQATGTVVNRTYYLSLLAAAYGTVGQIGHGRAVLAEAMTCVAHTGERWWEAELHRLNGELLVEQGENHQTVEAERCMRLALERAQSQQAKSLELRAATSLARLWQQQGKRNEARELLAPVYDRFTEGFDSADLIEAKQLLDELSAEVGPPAA